MRFCLQCGAPLAAAASMATTVIAASPAIDLPTASPAAPPVPASASSEPRSPFPVAPDRLAEDLPAAQAAPAREPTISLKIAPSVVIAPRVAAPLDLPRIEPAPEPADAVEEALRKAFERPPVQPGTVACRFCKGPLHLEGEYCEQCGAPVEDAAPPGVFIPKPKPAAPVASTPAIAPASARTMAQTAPFMAPPAANLTARPPVAPPTPAPARTMPQPWPFLDLPVAKSTARPPLNPSPAPVLPGPKAAPLPKPLLRTRAPLVARPPKPKLAIPEPPPGLMGRLKGLLKTKKVNFPVRVP
jgi:hypothetical protein